MNKVWNYIFVGFNKLLLLLCDAKNEMKLYKNIHFIKNNADIEIAKVKFKTICIRMNKI